jgi:hypothetical protein
MVRARSVAHAGALIIRVSVDRRVSDAANTQMMRAWSLGVAAVVGSWSLGGGYMLIGA